MGVEEHRHEDLVSKRDVCERFDRVDDRLFDLTNASASTFKVLANLNERAAVSEARQKELEANQRKMLEILERIEASTSQQIWL